MFTEHFQYQSGMVPVEVLQEVLNVPMAAILSIGREEGVLNNSEQGECVSVGSLSVYADAYIRKLKSYFRRMTSRHTSELDPREESDFIEFCTLYKKSDLTYSRAKKWEDIDTDFLYIDFFDLVKEKSPSSFNRSTSPELPYPLLFSPLGGFKLRYDETKSAYRVQYDDSLSNLGACYFIDSRAFLDQLVVLREPQYPEAKEKPRKKRRQQILTRIVRSSVYLFHKSNFSPNIQDIRRVFIRRFFLPSRFHIFASDDDILPEIAA